MVHQKKLVTNKKIVKTQDKQLVRTHAKNSLEDIALIRKQPPCVQQLWLDCIYAEQFGRQQRKIETELSSKSFGLGKSFLEEQGLFHFEAITELSSSGRSRIIGWKVENLHGYYYKDYWEVLPAGEEVLPAGEEVLPAGKEVLPAGKEVLLREKPTTLATQEEKKIQPLSNPELTTPQPLPKGIEEGSPLSISPSKKEEEPPLRGSPPKKEVLIEKENMGNPETPEKERWTLRDCSEGEQPPSTPHPEYSSISRSVTSPEFASISRSGDELVNNPLTALPDLKLDQNTSARDVATKIISQPSHPETTPPTSNPEIRLADYFQAVPSKASIDSSPFSDELDPKNEVGVAEEVEKVERLAEKYLCCLTPSDRSKIMGFTRGQISKLCGDMEIYMKHRTKDSPIERFRTVISMASKSLPVGTKTWKRSEIASQQSSEIKVESIAQCNKADYDSNEYVVAVDPNDFGLKSAEEDDDNTPF